MTDELYEMTKSLLQEIANINRKYDFAHDGRSPEDEARSKELWVEVHRLENEYDQKHCVTPCPECGEPCFASMGGVCFNWYGNCKLAKPLGG